MILNLPRESAQIRDQPTSTSQSTSRSEDLEVSSHNSSDSPRKASQTSKLISLAMPWQVLLKCLIPLLPTTLSYYRSSARCRINSTWDRWELEMTMVAMRCKLCALILISRQQAIIIQCLMRPRRPLPLEICLTPSMINSISQSSLMPAIRVATYRNYRQSSEMQAWAPCSETPPTNSPLKTWLRTRPWHRHIRTRL